MSALQILLAALTLVLAPSMLFGAGPEEQGIQIVELEFSGYRFGQEPSANMVCLSGYCKSQAPGGDGLVTFPYSTYGTPGAVSTLSGLAVVNPRYTFWNDRLYRVFFQVDCTPLEMEECVDDVIVTLDREYTLTPISANESRQFVLDRHTISREFLTASGAYVKVRAMTFADGSQMPTVDISDRVMTNQVGSSLSPNFKPKKPVLPKILPQNR